MEAHFQSEPNESIKVFLIVSNLCLHLLARMATQQGKPWSGSNPIPNIKEFVENLDKDKKGRDKRIDEEKKLHKLQHEGEATPHTAAPKQTDGKTVTDPTTGKQVVIDDVGKDFMKAVRDPQVFSAKVPDDSRPS